MEVTSEITGIVSQIVVQVGESVRENDVLVILESMKMEIPITAPLDGVVKEIRVRKEELVPEGAVLLVLAI